MFQRVNSHSDYLSKNLPKYNFIEGLDGFNLSFISYGDQYIFCVRCIALIPGFFGEEVIPGNYSNKKDFVMVKSKTSRFNVARLKFGQNFIWNNWTQDYLDNIIFFVGDIDWGKMTIIPNKKIKPLAYQNIPIFYKGECTNFKYSDIRLFKFGKKILMYGGFVSAIHEILVHDSKLYTSIIFTEDPIYTKYKFYFNRKFCDEIREYDKNWSFIEELGTGDKRTMTFLNWYEKKHVSMTSLNARTCTKTFIIRMERDVIYGNDKEHSLGMFSFGVPFFSIGTEGGRVGKTRGKKKGGTPDFRGISVGHIKIPYTSNKYNNPALRDFLNKVEQMDIVRHNSYDYLIYFIYLERSGCNYRMLISNAFLLMDNSQKYAFSINYPMAVEVKSGAVLISLGVGDFYTYFYKLPLKDFLGACTHDISNFEIAKYKYILKSAET